MDPHYNPIDITAVASKSTRYRCDTLIYNTEKMMNLKKKWIELSIVFTITMMVFVVVRQRISITDGDAISYIEGSYSIQQIGQYVSLNGDALNHWPPAYSLVLSFFSEPLQASFWINVICFSLAMTFLWEIGRRSNWNRYALMGFIVAFGFGFLRYTASWAKPDILTYALFFLATLFYITNEQNYRLISYLIWGILIPFKLVALVFIPSALIVLWFRRKEIKVSAFEVLAGSFIWVICVGSVVLFNLYTIGTVIPQSHAETTPSILVSSLIRFIDSLGREFLASWYGSLREPSYLVCFIATLIVAILSLLTLRYVKANRTIFLLGIANIALSFGLILIRDFDLGARLLGYGLLLALISLNPPKAHMIWGVYGSAAVLLMFYNMSSASSWGLNDPRYQALAQRVVGQEILPSKVMLYTNADQLLGVLARIPTQSILSNQQLDTLQNPDYFLDVTLPNYDAIMQPIAPIRVVGSEWCKIKSIEGATLYQRCDL